MFRRLFIICLLLVTTNTFPQEFKVGDEVPEFKLWLTNGERLTKNDIQNKVVVFKFWFTTCLPCKVDIPELNELVDEYRNNNDILFIAPALDRKDIIEKFTYYTPFKFKIAYSAMDVSRIFNKRQAYPFYYVIDKSGRFIYVDNPNKKSQIIGLKKAIERILNKEKYQ